MPSITLYADLASPPCLTVRFVASVLGIDVKIKEVDLSKGDNEKEDFLKINVQHTVPVIDDNGLIITESRAIIMYLSDKYGKNDSLYPKDLGKRILVDQKLFFDQDLYNKTLVYIDPLFSGKELDQHRKKRVEDGLSVLNKMLEGKKWITGDTITIADYTLFVTVDVAKYIDAAGIDITKHPNVTKWFASVKATIPKNQEIYAEYDESLKKYL